MEYMNAFNKLMPKGSPKVDLAAIKREVMQDKEISELAQGIDIDNFLAGIMDYQENKVKCIDCPGLDSCQQSEQGYKPSVIRHGNCLDFTFEECTKLRAYNSRHNINIKAMHLPERLLKLTLRDIFKDAERNEILDYFNMFMSKYRRNGDLVKGMYIYGKAGLGKTYLLAAMATELAQLGHSVILVNYPDLIRELKGSIADGTQFQKIEDLKRIDILMIDDIGTEKVTEYTRDEILAPILQYRMLDEKPTFFSSNLNQMELLNHLAEDEHGKNQMKGFRILERIKTLSTPFELTGTRYRK